MCRSGGGGSVSALARVRGAERWLGSSSLPTLLPAGRGGERRRLMPWQVACSLMFKCGYRCVASPKVVPVLLAAVVVSKRTVRA
jgi:hypothetical protein